MSFFLNHLTESNSSDHWDISGFDIGSLDQTITRIYLVAHENEFNQGSSSRPVLVNQWSIYLAISRTRSVQVDFGVGKKGVVRLVDKDDTQCFLRRSTGAFVLAISLVKHRRRRMESPIHLKVQDVLTILIRNGRDRYKVQNDDAVADDSRFWMYTVVSDFVKEGIVEEKDRARVWKVINRYWPFPKGSRSVACPIVKGVFVS
ncbi:hypothetical protein AGABI1DRAFT_130135 [Agaricus bisporus var. burnettii JB137-S8]|uniref:DUF7770 domain-containing protein n=1 Tax=Agaricus bisporus var. burnettii (strain JB137-S8 / ATCC MYA-4627 / FGSC 10392) TaxID=597362 RepID=K5X3V5_AGABU|nr:uncharacterized protein AGABI1DRAFT_130135 [Agaricus bisporus var. burnettii JB137-S8]EKM77863.1 hypothetical protein AGABI1DRAFT_130135 [Agaricus bisporus var. burnettii JB137-S8]